MKKENEINVDLKDSLQNFKVYRIMSIEEFKKFIKGEELEAYNKPGMSTSAQEPTFYFAGNMNDLYYLTANIDEKSVIICEFLANKDLFKEGIGTTICSYEFGLRKEIMEIGEYHIDRYSNKELQLINCAYLRDVSGDITEKEIKDFISSLDSERLLEEFYAEKRDAEYFADIKADGAIRFYKEESQKGLSYKEIKEKVDKMSDADWDKYDYPEEDYYEEEYYDEDCYDEDCYDSDENRNIKYTSDEVEDAIEIKESDLVKTMEEIIESEKVVEENNIQSKE